MNGESGVVLCRPKVMCVGVQRLTLCVLSEALLSLLRPPSDSSPFGISLQLDLSAVSLAEHLMQAACPDHTNDLSTFRETERQHNVYG